MVNIILGTVMEQVWFDYLCCGSWNTKCQMERFGYRFAEAKPGGSIIFSSAYLMLFLSMHLYVPSFLYITNN